MRVYRSRVARHRHNAHLILFDRDLDAPVLLVTLRVVATVWVGIRRDGLRFTEAADSDA